MVKDKSIILEQYKLYVETAEEVSRKRQKTNTYFLSLNSFLLILSGYLTTISFQFWHILIFFAGIVICILWILNLQSYREINTAKYKVIHKMEKKLPVKLFDDEWTLLGRGKNNKLYRKLSVVEQWVPAMFIFLYWIALVLSLLTLF